MPFERPACPADWTPLEPRHTEAGVQVEACPRCSGAWVPAERVEAALQGGVLPAYHGLDTATRPCVACGGMTVPRQGRHGRVDICLSCKSAWVYSGDLRELAAPVAVQLRPREAEPEPPRRWWHAMVRRRKPGRPVRATKTR